LKKKCKIRIFEHWVWHRTGHASQTMAISPPTGSRPLNGRWVGLLLTRTFLWATRASTWLCLRWLIS